MNDSTKKQVKQLIYDVYTKQCDTHLKIIMNAEKIRNNLEEMLEDDIPHEQRKSIKHSINRRKEIIEQRKMMIEAIDTYMKRLQEEVEILETFD